MLNKYTYYFFTTLVFLQAKYKQEREERKKLLTPAHKYMIDILADRLSLAPTEVEEFVLDSPSVSSSSV